MNRALTLTGYVVLAVAAVSCQVIAVVGGRRATLGDVVHAIKQSPSGRVALVVAWGWIGWHLFVRR